jgi:hypothetical protein
MIMYYNRINMCKYISELKKMASQIINYEQGQMEYDESPRTYYDPTIMLAETQYKIKPLETVLIVINGRGYRWSDDTVYELKIKPNTVSMNDVNSENSISKNNVNQDKNSTKNSSNSSSSSSTKSSNSSSSSSDSSGSSSRGSSSSSSSSSDSSMHSIKSDKDIEKKKIINTPVNNNYDILTDVSTQLCLLIKNCSENYTIYVGAKTPLQWLLDAPRIISKLCHSSIVDITSIRLNEHYCDNNINNNDNYINNMFTPEKTIVIR